MGTVLYVIPPAKSHRTAEENLGVGYIASYLRDRGIIVKIIDGWLSGETLDVLINSVIDFIKNTPDILFVGISTYVSNIEEVKQIVECIKKYCDVMVVAGGFGPSFFSNDFLKIGVDVVAIGEGELTSYELCMYCNGKIALEDIDGIAFKDDLGCICFTPKRNMIEDINSFPFPARDTISDVLRRKSTVNIMSSRGCMGHCSFCSVIAFHNLSNGSLWRERSIESFVDEVEHLHAMGINFFKVIDDSFIEKTRDEKWCRKLADTLEERGISCRFRGSIIADNVTDGVIRELKRAGFFSFACGVENFSPSSLKRLGKRASADVNIRALNVFNRYGIYVQCGMILFDPYTTIEELRINLECLKDFRWIITKGIFTELYAAKGTEFTNKLMSDVGDVYRPCMENYLYTIKDEAVMSVYFALKKWHKLQSEVYDLIIDPITAPKNISLNGYQEFYSLYRQIHDRDLDVLNSLLDMVYIASKQEMLEYVTGRYEAHKGYLTELSNLARDIYVSEDLEMYNGISNKYLFIEEA